MQATAFDRREAQRAIDEVAERLIAMVSAASDPTVQVPATPEWTVADAFAHLVTGSRYIQGIRGQDVWAHTPDDLSGQNARYLSELPSRDIGWLAAKMRSTLATLGDLIERFGDDQPVIDFHAGQKIPAELLLGMVLGEGVMHGRDIAEALSRPWPIDPRHVELIVQGFTPLMPGWLNPERVRGHTARYEVRLRGQGIHRLAFEDGQLTMNPPGPFRPEVVISANPGAFLLVMYKRKSQWPAIFTGKLIAWGRKPWLAFSFNSRFHQP